MHKNFIGGEWVDGADAADNINPSDTRDVVGRYARADAAQARAAIAAAHAALPRWAACTPQQRADALEQVGNEIAARQTELADLLAREEGKPLARGQGRGAARRAHLQVLRRRSAAHGRRADRIDATRPERGDHARARRRGRASSHPGTSRSRYRPGKSRPPSPTATRWSSSLPIWCPGCAWALADILSRAGLPPGMFNLVMGRGRDIGDTLLTDPRVAAISFTGSQTPGASRSRQRRACARDGQVPARDGRQESARRARRCRSGSGGGLRRQRRVLLHRAALHRVVAAHRHPRHPRSVRRRDGRTPAGAEGRGRARRRAPTVGPVVDASQLAQDTDYIEIGRREGATLAFGGRCSARWKGGRVSTSSRRCSSKPPTRCASAARRSSDRSRRDPRARLRRGAGAGQRHRVRTLRRRVHDLAEVGGALQAARCRPAW